MLENILTYIVIAAVVGILGIPLYKLLLAIFDPKGKH